MKSSTFNNHMIYRYINGSEILPKVGKSIPLVKQSTVTHDGSMKTDGTKHRLQMVGIKIWFNPWIWVTSVSFNPSFHPLIFEANSSRPNVSERYQPMEEATTTYMSCMDTGHVRETPTPKIAVNKVLSYLYFRHLKLLVIRDDEKHVPCALFFAELAAMDFFGGRHLGL